MAVKMLILLVLVGFISVNSKESCDGEFAGFCGAACDDEHLCTISNCKSNLCFDEV